MLNRLVEGRMDRWMDADRSNASDLLVNDDDADDGYNDNDDDLSINILY